MEVRLAVGEDGTAVLRDYRWSEVGMRLAMLRFNDEDPDVIVANPAKADDAHLNHCALSLRYG